MFKVRNKRETGFEILRILAMFFILCHHVFCYRLGYSEQSKLLVMLIETLFIPSVNVFILVSAYFMVNSSFKFKRLLYLWLQVLFYSILCYLVNTLLLGNSFSIKTFIVCFFPVVSNKYWFFTAYFVLMLLSPFLNKILNNASKKELYLLSGLLFILSYLYMKQPIGYVFNLNGGFSVFWFICLYIFAGTIKLYPLTIKKRYVFIIYCISILTLWLMNLYNTNNYWYNLIHNSLSYTSTLVIIASTSLILLFKDINIKNIYIHNNLCYVASLTFGIYLIENSHLQNLLHGFFQSSVYYTSFMSPFYVLLIALRFFIFLGVIETIRKLVVLLFRKIVAKIKTNKQNNQEMNNINEKSTV